MRTPQLKTQLLATDADARLTPAVLRHDVGACLHACCWRLIPHDWSSSSAALARMVLACQLWLPCLLQPVHAFCPPFIPAVCCLPAGLQHSGALLRIIFKFAMHVGCLVSAASVMDLSFMKGLPCSFHALHPTA